MNYVRILSAIAYIVIDDGAASLAMRIHSAAAVPPTSSPDLGAFPPIVEVIQTLTTSSPVASEEVLDRIEGVRRSSTTNI